LLVDTCTQGGMVGRLAERRLVLNQEIEEVGRHGASEDENARVRWQAYIIDRSIRSMSQSVHDALCLENLCIPK
jgi:hypothetical protein